MSYFINKELDNISFEEVYNKTIEALKGEGFGIITEIDMKATLKKKLDVDYKPYKILGACNPNFAYEALKFQSKVGVFLPCNVIIEENLNGNIEVSAVDPVASMMAVESDDLSKMADEVKQKLTNVINSL